MANHRLTHALAGGHQMVAQEATKMVIADSTDLVEDEWATSQHTNRFVTNAPSGWFLTCTDCMFYLNVKGRKVWEVGGINYLNVNTFTYSCNMIFNHHFLTTIS